MGSYYGAEIYKLVGLYILHDLTEDKKINKTKYGLYRDDGLLIVKQRSPRIIDQLRKSITKFFQKNDLKVKTELCNQSVDFLNITMDLKKKVYSLFRWENAKTI